MASDRLTSKCTLSLLVMVFLVLAVLVTLAVTLTSHTSPSADSGLHSESVEIASPECIVAFDDGLVVGSRRQTFTALGYCAYEGIPYVEPPIGRLRFKDPQPVRFRGSRVLGNVSRACPQAYAAHMDPLATSEDCLYLNVYTGTVAKEHDDDGDSLWPVLLWIHGGSFVVGSSETDIFGPEFLVDQGIIVVTFNYRLAALGFLSMPDLGINANLGLLDQLEALRWVARNIRQFGGDPHRVTLCGWSAGAAAVTYHLYSPAAKGLFQRAIAMSGSMTQSWAYDYDPDRCGREFLKANDATTREQLQDRPLDRLMIFGREFHIDFFSLFYYCFLPTDDTYRAGRELRFVGRDPFETVRTEPPVSDVPLLAGYTTLEHGNLFLERDFGQTSNNFPNFNRTLVPLLDAYLQRRATDRAPQARNRSSAGPDFYRQLASVADIIYGIQYFVRQAAPKMRSPVYRYLFAYDGAFGYAKNWYYRNQIVRRPGPMHGDDLGYLFTPYLYRRKYWQAVRVPGDPEDATRATRYRAERRVQRRMVRLWSNFIKHGNPTPAVARNARTLRWHPYNDPSSGGHYLRIDRRMQLLPVADAENPFYRLWDRVFGCLYEFECDFLNVKK
ncbi:esterase B1-like [Anopheles bellator]|uniref:esterase B1-like n=1 Tax=Anopheles bellator TaxID=139047 RepID=UPI00264943CD|nr:esterase B1-like [Anopheles bellator]